MDSSDSILVRRFGTKDGWVEPETSAYSNEAHLQELLAGDPARIPGVAEGSAAVRELATSAGPVDVCTLGPDAQLTVVECKLASNSEKRRMVIGQVIDYAAAIRQDGSKAFAEAWKRRDGTDLDDFLGEHGREALEHNIASGQIALCLAVDRIDADLQRLIEHLNVITKDEVTVTALQLSYARHGELEILIPSTYGGEIAAAKARRTTTHWTIETFLAELRPDDRARAQDLLGRLADLDRRGSHDTIWCGARPSGAIFFCLYGLRYPPFRLWIDGAGRLALFANWTNYPALTGHPGFSELATFLGQDASGRAPSVVLADLDLDALWEISKGAAVAIND